LSFGSIELNFLSAAFSAALASSTALVFASSRAFSAMTFSSLAALMAAFCSSAVPFGFNLASWQSASTLSAFSLASAFFLSYKSVLSYSTLAEAASALIPVVESSLSSASLPLDFFSTRLYFLSDLWW
jgi:hypothetical protein